MTIKEAIESQFTDSCTVTVKTKHTDPTTKITDFTESVLYQDKPCRLSFKTIAPTNGDVAASAEQTDKLFISSALTIPAGSKITVIHEGRTYVLSSSGEPAVYPYNQEIMLEKFERWA